METKKLLKEMLLVITFTIFIGCSGSSGGNNSSNGSNSQDSVSTGTFIDAPVKGLKYKTKTQEGFTDENGKFKYKIGEKVEFFLGNLSFGVIDGTSTITPYTLADVPTGTNNQKAINIALMLQNLDGNRGDKNILDVSKLKDFDFNDFNLEVSNADMEGKISNKLTSGAFDQFIDTNNKNLLGTTVVKEAMDTYVKKELLKQNDLSKIYGKLYTITVCYEFLGCLKKRYDNSISSDAISYIVQNKTVKSKFEKVDDGLYTIVWDDAGTDKSYWKILSLSETVINYCEREKEEDARQCSKSNRYLVLKEKSDSFVKTKDDSLGDKLITKKTRITQLSDIQNKMFYQIMIRSKKNELKVMKIVGDKLEYYYGDTLDTLEMAAGQKKDVSFIDNILYTGTIDSMVFKYDLTGRTIEQSAIITDFLWADSILMLEKLKNKTFTFTSGKVYCRMSEYQCWLDLDALKQMKKQLEEGK